MAKKKTEHYVNNREFTGAMTDWIILLNKTKKEAEEQDIEYIRPKLTEYIASCFLKIATKYASRPNFSGYTYKEDMIGEAVYICLRYAHNFNPEKSNNAFSYFTQYCHNTFIQFIGKEKKFADFKFELVKDAEPKLAKNDFKNITLFDEDNTGIEDLEKQEEEIIAAHVIPVQDIIKEETNDKIRK